MTMIPTNNEIYTLELTKRKKNSSFEWEDAPLLRFKGRPANQVEKKNYRIQKGVNGGSDSVFVFATNLPTEVDINDQIKFMGKIWTVQSIGYYFNEARLVNADLLSEEQIVERCPKGINLQ